MSTLSTSFLRNNEWRDTKAFNARGIDRSSHKAKWGQHFLIDDQIIEKIVSYADITPTETI